MITYIDIINKFLTYIDIINKFLLWDQNCV